MRNRVLLISFVLALVAFSASAVLAADVFSGTWKMNIPKSEFSGPTRPPEPAIQTIKINGKALNFTEDSIARGGGRQHQEFTANLDGKEYPVKNLLDGEPNPNGFDTVSIVKFDDFTVELKFRHQGKIGLRANYIVSHDGKTRSVLQARVDDQGQPNLRIVVYDKQ